MAEKYQKSKIKCIASTCKAPNSKRSGKIISQCTHFALEGSRFCERHQNLNHLTDEEFKNHTRYCKSCNKHVYFSDMTYATCESCRATGAENRVNDRNHRTVYPECKICQFTGGNRREYPDYCNIHQNIGRKEDIERRDLNVVKESFVDARIQNYLLITPSQTVIIVELNNYMDNTGEVIRNYRNIETDRR